jgi:predicted transcriptional regulator YdeE
MVKATPSSEAGKMPTEQLIADMTQYNEELMMAGIMKAGEGLKPTSQAVRVRFSGKDRTVIDGPFAETKELVAGYWIWEVKSMEEAIEWVKRCPNPMEEDSDIDIRPIYGAEDFGEEFTPQLREQEAALRATLLGLGPVRFEQSEGRRIAGDSKRYNKETMEKIPEQWHEFSANFGKIPGQIGTDAFGVSYNTSPECEFDYLTGVQVGEGAQIPSGFSSVDLPASRYAVFTHNAPVSEMPKAFETIWSEWVPECGLPVSRGACFEKYSEEFNPNTGMGGMEIWIPLESEI